MCSGRLVRVDTSIKSFTIIYDEDLESSKNVVFLKYNRKI